MTYQPPSDYTTQGRHWTDLNTGCVYQLDEDETSPTYGEYYLVSCPTPGPPGEGTRRRVPDSERLLGDVPDSAAGPSRSRR